MRGFSLCARLAHSRRTWNACVREGGTAGVKATFWPEAKSGGAWLMAISESKGQIYVQGMYMTATTPIGDKVFPTTNGKPCFIIKALFKKTSNVKAILAIVLINYVNFQSLGWYCHRKLVEWLSPFRGTILKKKKRSRTFKSLLLHAPHLMFRLLWERSHAPADRCNIWGCLSPRGKRLGTAGHRCAETHFNQAGPTVKSWSPTGTPPARTKQFTSATSKRQLLFGNIVWQSSSLDYNVPADAANLSRPQCPLLRLYYSPAGALEV